MFERNADNYSLRDQLALHKATVAVCGLGGGGGYVAEILARTGVGKFILIDGDCFEDSNRNRQIGALGSTLGRLKVEVVGVRLCPSCVHRPGNGGSAVRRGRGVRLRGRGQQARVERPLS